MAKIPGTKTTPVSTSKASPKEINDTFSDADAQFVGDPVPAGQYTLRANNGQVKYYDERPFVTARLTIMEGPLKGKGYEQTFWLDHEKEDGSPTQSMAFSLGKLVVMFGGIPADVMAAGKSNKQRLAEAVASAINNGGAEFVGIVGSRTYKNGAGEDVTRNDLVPTRPKNWQPK